MESPTERPGIGLSILLVVIPFGLPLCLLVIVAVVLLKGCQ